MAALLFRHPGLLAGLYWVLLALGLGLTAFFVLKLDRRPWTSFGFAARPAAGAQVATGFALGGALLATVFVVGWLAGWYRVVGVQPPGRGWLAAGAWLAVLIPQSTLEEVAMRGYVLQAVEARYGWRWGLAVSAVVFAALHMSNPNAGGLAMVGLVMSGVYLGAAYLFTRRLWLPSALHTAWNFFEGPVFGFAVSGVRIPDGILRTETRGPSLWTGGAFGPEAGLLLTLAMLVHLGALAWATRPFRVAAVAREEGAPPAAGPEPPPMV